MSGIEVVGIVLAVFPLIISALEHKRGIAIRWNKLAKFNARYGKAWDNLRDEELILRLHLQRLLLPLVAEGTLPEGELEACMLDPGGPLWKSGDVDKALKGRLGETYERYVDVLAELQDLAWEVLRPLVQNPAFENWLNESAGTSQSQLPSKYRLMRRTFASLTSLYERESARLKFALSQSDTERIELVQTIQQKVELLTKFLDGSDQVAVLVRAQSANVSAHAVQTLLQYWKYAGRVYGLLYRSWICPCKRSHCAHLWLQHHAVPQSDFQMRLLVSSPGSGPSPRGWRQQGLCIQRLVVAEGVQEHSIVVASASAVPIPRVSTPVARPAPVPKPGILGRKPRPRLSINSVRFGAGAAVRTTYLAAQSEHPAAKKSKKDSTDTDNTSIAEPKEISDLCRELEGCGMQKLCIGSLTDDDDQCQYVISSEPSQKILADEISLFDILDHSHTPRLRRVQRFQIALKVASSHLKLVSTPWARRQWTSLEIRFPNTSVTGQSVLLDQPFVSADFSDEAPSVGQAPKQTDRSFACLGIMLLELLFGVQLEAHELWQRLGQVNADDDLLRLMVAKKWADEVLEEAGPEYEGAVLYCLNESPTTLQGDQWRKDLADRVVLPLQSCCEYLSPATST